jgi:hypothetical protein
MSSIHISRKTQQIDLLSNAPLPKVKITRFTNCAKNPHPALDWHIGTQNQIEQQEFDIQIYNSSEIALKQTIFDQAKKSERLKKNEIKQKERFHQSLFERKQAIKTLSEPKVIHPNIEPSDADLDIESNVEYIKKGTRYYPLQREKTKSDIEKSLRIKYRVGMIDEMKKKQFGREFRDNVKVYSDITGIGARFNNK